VAFLRQRAVAQIEAVEGEVYRRSFCETEQGSGTVVSGVLEIAAQASGIRVRLPAQASAVAPAILRRVRHLFDLDADAVGDPRHLLEDPELRRLLAAHPDLRVPGTWDGFECAVRTIVGQQVSVKGAATLVGRIVERCGGVVVGAGATEPERLFPTPSALRNANLDGLGLIQRRIETLRELAAAVDCGALELSPGVDYPHLRRQLEALPGVGAWTAQYISLRLGDRDAFPASDLGLLRALDPARRLKPKELEARAERWRPHRAFAAQLLWRHDAAILGSRTVAAT
jgi:DNA-3-methyladenine glycosylase II